MRKLHATKRKKTVHETQINILFNSVHLDLEYLPLFN